MASDGAAKSSPAYQYNPSVAAAVIFIVIFAGSTICHTYQIFTKRTWYFIPFLIGCLFEVLGYAARTLSASQTPNWQSGPFIMQTILLLLSPTLFAASIYMVLGRLIRLLDAGHLSLIRLNWLTKVFVLGDVLSFLVQGGGGGILASAKDSSTQTTGNDIILVGLVIQILFFGFFITTTAVFHRRILQRPTPQCSTVTVPWQRYIIVLYVASSFIMIRSLFRLIEYAAGRDSAIQKSEAYAYVFDGLLMFVVVVLFNVFPPSQIIAKGKAQNGLADEESVLAGHGEQDAYVNVEDTGYYSSTSTNDGVKLQNLPARQQQAVYRNL